MKEYKIMGQNIKAERIRKGLTQEEVAEILDIDRRTYINYEKKVRNITPMILFKLSNIFDCKLDTFYMGINTTDCGEE